MTRWQPVCTEARFGQCQHFNPKTNPGLKSETWDTTLYGDLICPCAKLFAQQNQLAQVIAGVIAR